MAMVCAQFIASLDCTGKGMQLLQLLHTPEHSMPKMAARVSIVSQGQVSFFMHSDRLLIMAGC